MIAMWRKGAIAGTLVAMLLVAPAALGDGFEEREVFVERAEPICKSNVLANKRIFKGAKGEVKAGKLKLASRHFLRAATAFEKTIKQLEGVPPPPADTAKLNKWFGLLRQEKLLIEKIGNALAAEEKHKASSLSVDLNRNSTKANNAVLGFGFDYCRIEPSRFG